MSGPIQRAFRLGAGILACLALGLLGSRWQATRALDSARERTEALGLRLDPDATEQQRSPEADAAIAEAWRVCRAIDDAVDVRYEAEYGSSAFDDAVDDALRRAEAGRASDVLMVTAARYLATGAAPRRLPLAHGYVPRLPGEAAALLDDEHVLALYLVQHLSRAASVNVEAGAIAEAWRALDAAAEVYMTLRDTDLFRFSLLRSGLRALQGPFDEAVAAEPSDPLRARIRATLGELDAEAVARATLRWSAAATLRVADTRSDLASVHSVAHRALGHDLRDLADLHHGWADIVEVSEQTPASERCAALKAIPIRARSSAAAGRPSVTEWLLPDASFLWECVAAIEAYQAALLAE